MRAEDTLLMLVDAEGEASTRRLTESLVEAAGELLHCRDEQGVLETAVEAIHRHGFSVMVLLLEGDSLRYGPLRQDAAQVTTCEVLYGKPLQDIRFPRSSMPHIDEVLARHKAAFHSDFLQVLENVRTMEPLAWLRRAYPSVRALDAPIFVQGKPYGILSVQGETLTPTSAATLELFARQVGGRWRTCATTGWRPRGWRSCHGYNRSWWRRSGSPCWARPRAWWPTRCATPWAPSSTRWRCSSVTGWAR
ncbi:GAF domain-containing protein [Cystobacter fuscus]